MPWDVYADVPAEFWQSAPVLGLIWFLGACWGSFLNVCVYRIPAELSVVYPGSRCSTCKKAIAWYDNLPVLSWFLLRGKCRHCGARFSFRYALVEAITGGLFLGIWMLNGPTWITLAYWLMTFGLLLGTFVDIDEMWIPDRVTWGGMILGVPLGALLPALHGAATWQDGLRLAAIGAAVGFGILYGVGKLGTFLFKKDAMGFGDVKLLGAIGAFLGWQAVLFVVFASALLGSIVGVSFIALGKNELGGKIPFGPYLAAAALIWVFGGDGLFDWYVGWLTAPPGLPAP